MAEVKKIVVEEFDDEGNLVKRTTTEYDNLGVNKATWEYPGIRVGDVWPYQHGQVTYADPSKITVWNDLYNQGTYARRTPGGTDRKADGTVIE